MTTHDAELAALLSGITIAHQIPGRVRLKLLRLPELLRASVDAPTLTRFFSGLRQIPGIIQVKLNALAQSCTITYTSSLLPDYVWREALTAPPAPSPATRDFMERLQQNYLESREAK
jgi:hypothetical protein